MKPKTLAILAATVTGLAAFIALYEKKLPSTDERKDQEKKAFRLEADDVVAIEIEHGGAKVRLERDANPAPPEGSAPAFPPPREWRLVEPMSAKADRTLADQLAATLAGLEIERRLEGAARKDVGLEPPKGIIRFRSGDAQGTLEIGGAVPASSNVVVAASGQSEPLVVAKSIAESLERAPGDWRAKDVVSAGRDDIERIRIVSASGGEVVLSRKGTSFVVERPYADAADRDAVDPLLGDLTGLRAEKFLDAPLASEAAAGLAALAGRLELSVKGKTEPISIELGAPVTGGSAAPPAGAPPEGAVPEGGSETSRYVKVGGQTIEAKTRLAEAVARAAEAWRSKAWTAFDSWKVERIRVEDAAGKLELKRDAGDWRKDGAKISYTDVGDLLYAVTSARAEKLLSGDAAKALPATPPTATIVFSDAEGAEETLTLHGAVDGGVAARVSGRDVVLVLPQKTAEELVAKIASVRAAKPVEEGKPVEEAKPADQTKPGDETKPVDPTPPPAEEEAPKPPEP